MSENGTAVAAPTGSAATPVIELREIDVFYGRVNALSKVSMVVGQGEIAATKPARRPPCARSAA
jgi:hypothetical protein